MLVEKSDRIKNPETYIVRFEKSKRAKKTCFWK